MRFLKIVERLSATRVSWAARLWSKGVEESVVKALVDSLKEASGESDLERVEFQSAILVRNLEMTRRRGEFYIEVDRSGYLLLRILQANGPLDIGELSSILGLEQSTTGRQVAAADKAGLVERSQDLADKRRSIISMTAEGRTALNQVRARRLEGTTTILDGWSQKDMRNLADTFERYNRAIEAHYI